MPFSASTLGRPADTALVPKLGDGQAFPPAAGGMRRRDFFADIVAHLRLSLSTELQAFEHSLNASLLKVYYGNERVHYEVWANSQTRTIEIGLHCEDGPITTAAYLAHFDTHIVELKHLLGPGVELERWTSSWGHLYELMPLTTLDADLAREAAGRLSAMIDVLQPLVLSAGIEAERSASPLENEARGPWRKWRRGGR